MIFFPTIWIHVILWFVFVTFRNTNELSAKILSTAKEMFNFYQNDLEFYGIWETFIKNIFTQIIQFLNDNLSEALKVPENVALHTLELLLIQSDKKVLFKKWKEISTAKNKLKFQISIRYYICNSQLTGYHHIAPYHDYLTVTKTTKPQNLSNFSGNTQKFSNLTLTYQKIPSNNPKFWVMKCFLYKEFDQKIGNQKILYLYFNKLIESKG